MQINGAGPSGIHPEPPIAPITNAPVANAPVTNAPAPVTSPGNDTIGSLLEQLSSAPVAQLVAGIEASHPAADPFTVTNLLQTAVAAALQGDVHTAVAALTELVQRSPEQVETLAEESSLSPIRAQVQDLLAHVTTNAKREAEMRFQTATQAVESTNLHGRRPGDWNPREVLPIAAQLIQSGRHANILLATDLSQAVIHYQGGFEVASPRAMYPQARFTKLRTPPPSRAPWTAAIATIAGLLKRGWRESPLLLLFIVWVALGLMSAVAAGIELWSVNLSVEVWGAGSAGLLGYGTYRRIRG